MEDWSSPQVQPKPPLDVRSPLSPGPIRIAQVEAAGLGFFQLSKDSEISSDSPAPSPPPPLPSLGVSSSSPPSLLRPLSLPPWVSSGAEGIEARLR